MNFPTDNKDHWPHTPGPGMGGVILNSQKLAAILRMSPDDREARLTREPAAYARAVKYASSLPKEGKLPFLRELTATRNVMMWTKDDEVHGMCFYDQVPT